MVDLWHRCVTVVFPCGINVPLWYLWCLSDIVVQLAALRCLRRTNVILVCAVHHIPMLPLWYFCTTTVRNTVNTSHMYAHDGAKTRTIYAHMTSVGFSQVSPAESTRSGGRVRAITNQHNAMRRSGNSRQRASDKDALNRKTARRGAMLPLCNPSSVDGLPAFRFQTFNALPRSAGSKAC